MESLFWAFKTFDPLLLATPIFLNLAICFVVTQTDYLFLLVHAMGRGILGLPDDFRPLGPGERPSGLVVIPSLLRNDEDLGAITTTIESAATNEYPGTLVIVASVDGRTEHPDLYKQLQKWVATRSYPSNVFVYVTGTETRLGKMMAVEAGVDHMKKRVARGDHAAFPTLYFSIDGDGTLGDHAIERLAHRLMSRSPFTGKMRRVVAGKICIRPDLVWRGWRAFFTVEGQLYMQAAREFIVSNVSRYNWKLTPRIGIPGALYVTWTDLLLAAPRYMSFMHALRPIDAFRWWMGFGAPKFSESNTKPKPEALTGASDDTCIAFLASLASWDGDKLTFDAPKSPIHAFVRFLASYTYDRSHDYEPEARVFTYTPPTLSGLWKQRVRWNSSRVECAGRFWRAFWFHWEIGLPVSAHLLLLLHTVFEVVGYYIVLPYYIVGTSHALLGYVLGYAAQTFAFSAYTLMSLALERQRGQYWRVLMCLPFASAYSICINAFGCVYGVSRDIFLFGNATNFAPEWTLAKGGCERIAISFRIRRFLSLALRSVVHGDVPLGTFWFGWTETPWTPSGFEGWTTGKKPRNIFSFTNPITVAMPVPLTSPPPRPESIVAPAMPSLRPTATRSLVPAVAALASVPSLRPLPVPAFGSVRPPRVPSVHPARLTPSGRPMKLASIAPLPSIPPPARAA